LICSSRRRIDMSFWSWLFGVPSVPTYKAPEQPVWKYETKTVRKSSKPWKEAPRKARAVASSPTSSSPSVSSYDYSTDMMNPLNPLSPLSPLHPLNTTQWNEPTRSDPPACDNYRSDNYSAPEPSSSHDSGSCSSSYDSGSSSSDSGSFSSGGDF
jgi:hypothetical protein